MYIHVKVVPCAKKTEFTGKMDDEAYKIKLKAIPENGKANNELIKYLSKTFSINKKDISIISGHTNTHKLLKIPDNSNITW